VVMIVLSRKFTVHPRRRNEDTFSPAVFFQDAETQVSGILGDPIVRSQEPRLKLDSGSLPSPEPPAIVRAPVQKDKHGSHLTLFRRRRRVISKRR